MKKSWTLLIALLSLQNILPSDCWAKTICVDARAKKAGEGTCWESPFLTLQEALDLGEQDKTITEIWIAKGVYRPTKTYSPKNKEGHVVLAGAFSLKEYNPGILIDNRLIHYHDNPARFNQYLKTFQLVDNLSLYGGFQGQQGLDGGEQSKEARSNDPQLHQTILDGAIDGYQVWHVITAGNDITLAGVNVTLDRLVVRNGNAISAPYFPTHFPLKLKEVPVYYHDDAGGIYIFTKSKIYLKNVTLENNAGIAGGAIYVQDGSELHIVDSTFKNNVANGGGAINMRSGGPNEFLQHQYARITTLKITNSDFINNASFQGTAILINDTQTNPPLTLLSQNVHIHDCRFVDNFTLKTQNPNDKTSIALLSNIYDKITQKKSG